MILVSQIRLPLHWSENDAIMHAKRQLKIQDHEIASAEICKISVDARKKPPFLVYTVGIILKNIQKEALFAGHKNVQVVYPELMQIPFIGEKQVPPVICGCGPAGLFAGLVLARAGLRPVIIERGACVQERVQAIEAFEQNGILDEDANIQFGEGGAGTFSDGKLTTRIKDPLCAFVTSTLIEHGAPKEIAVKQKPHVGTDLLRNVIISIREELLRLGATVHFRTKLTGITAQNGVLQSIQTTKGEIPCQKLILAVGNSARDTFLMLHKMGLTLTPKPFSVGFRAEHLQSRIEESLYHEAAGHPALPRGEYQLSHHIGNRCVYSFCMCPGGEVVAATSEQGRVVTNGMSYHARDGKNANAAVVVSVSPEDFDNNIEKAISFQRTLEEKAYQAGGGNYLAPAETVQSFLNGEGKLACSSVLPTYARGVTPAHLGELFPQELTKALQIGLQAFDQKLSGYAGKDAVLTGVETRTSSPIRLLRTEYFENREITGLYPCGEGAGYAGGIMSAATDGVRVAKALMESYSNQIK